MDPKDKEIADLKKALADEKTAREGDKVVYANTIKEKDGIITQKNDDIVKQRQGYHKKLSELSEAEKAQMSEKEIELQQRNEELAERQEKFENDQKEFLAKEVGSRKDKLATRLAGKNPELKQKILDNMSRLNGIDAAQTEEELTVFAKDAYNMLGVPSANPVEEILGGGGEGRAPGQKEENGFAESEQGKSLANALGLSQANA